MRLFPVLAASLVTIATLASSVGVAQAQQGRFVARKVVETAPPLTVNRRSFLDPGPIVPRGSLNNYVLANTVLNRPVYTSFGRGFGEESLPQPLEIPGRRQPLVEFYTPAY